MVFYKVDDKTLEWIVADEDDEEDDNNSNDLDNGKKSKLFNKINKSNNDDKKKNNNSNDNNIQYHIGRIEKAKTGRGKCRGCGEKIEKLSIRIASPFKFKGEIISSWNHINCFARLFKDDILNPSFSRNYLFFGDNVNPEEANSTYNDIIEISKGLVLSSSSSASLLSDNNNNNNNNNNDNNNDNNNNNEDDDDEAELEKALLKQIEISKTQKVLPPSELRLKLLPFQQEGLGWMIYKENKSESEGGILADQMGMGKTIQMISLILASKYSSLYKRGKDLNINNGPTLIITPSSAMLQWKDEIERCCSPGSLSILVYHSGSRSKLTPSDIIQYDIVLTSYPIIEYDYRTAINIQKVTCEYCKRKFLPRKLKMHNKYFCGPNAMRTVKQQLTERAEKDARNDMIIKKAMGTLKIMKQDEDDNDNGNNDNDNMLSQSSTGKRKFSMPTPSAIYTELMQEANRVPTQMYINKAKARAIDEGKLSQKSKSTTNEDNMNKSYINKISSCENKSCNSKSNIKNVKHKDDENDDDFEENIEKKPKASIRRSSRKKIIIEVSSSSSENDEGKNEDDNDFEKESKNMEIENKSKSEIKSKSKIVAKSKSEIKSKSKIVAKSKSKSKSKAKTKTKSKSKSKSKNNVSESESEFEISDGTETLSSDDNGDDIDDELNVDVSDVEEIKPARKISKRSKKTNENKNNIDDDLVGNFTTTKARFIPQTWSRGNEPVERISVEPIKKTTKNKRGSKLSKSKQLSDDDDDLESDENLKKSKTKSKRKTNQKKKVYSSSSEEDEEDEKKNINNGNSKSKSSKSPIWYAKPGDVVDDEGNDIGVSLLHCIAWSRIVLDEAHKIKDRVNSTAKSVFGLRGTPINQYDSVDDDDIKDKNDKNIKKNTESWIRDKCHRWCLTGTPLQNRTGELYSLIRFLRIDPFAFFKCRGPTLTASEKKKKEQKKLKDNGNINSNNIDNNKNQLNSSIPELDCDSCSCTMLNWSFGWEAKICVHCGHTPMRHFSVFNLFVSNPIRRFGYNGEGKKAMKLLKNEILGQHMLRRTKIERASDINLPPLVIEVREIEMTEAERDFYEAIYKRTKSKFDTFIEKGTILNNFAHIFELLSRLRQATDHPYLVIHGNSSNSLSNDNNENENGEGDDNENKSNNINNYKPIAPTKSAGISDVCGICHLDIDGINNCAVSNCRHTFHRDCVEAAISSWELKHPNDNKDFEEDDDENDGDDDISNKNKKRKRGKKNDDKLNCPVCFQPLSITLDIRGIDEENDKIQNTSQSQLHNDDSRSSTLSSSSIQTDNNLNQTQTQQNGNICIVCMDAPRNALFLPCGHMLLCQSCSHSLNNRVCPVCRTKIVKIVRGESAITTLSSSNHIVPLTPGSQETNTSSLSSSPTIDSQLSSSSSLVSSSPTTAAATTSSSIKSSSLNKVLIGRKSILQRINLDEFSSSSKLDVIVEEIKKHEMLPIEDNGLPHKAIVFSQYTSMLHIIQWKLKRSGINTVMLFGSLNVQERKSVLNAFKTNPDVRVILMSLKSGGEGLNLQEASLVITCEPWWNSAVEMQAIQRAHRIGQTRKVTAIRCVIKNSVEERMMELQEKKRLIFEGTVEKNEQSLQQLSVEDLQFLFSR